MFFFDMFFFIFTLSQNAQRITQDVLPVEESVISQLMGVDRNFPYSWGVCDTRY